MKSKNHSSVFTRMLLAMLLVIAASALLINGLLVRGVSQSKQERQVENKIPKQVPITIKLKREKEKAFKDLKNEKWLQDFELEVTNTSNKPIYFLELFVVLPEVLAEDSHSVAIPLRYGRVDFIQFDTIATANDQPIPPGETLTFTIPEGNQKGWAWHKSKENRPDPTRVEIVFVQLSFGDGSGFNGTGATPYPHKTAQSSNNPCREDLALLDLPRDRATRIDAKHSFPDLGATYSFSMQPAAFLPTLVQPGPKPFPNHGCAVQVPSAPFIRTELIAAPAGSRERRNLSDVRIPKVNVL